MNERENLLSLLRRKGYEHIPVEFSLCPSLQEEFHRRYGPDANYQDHFGMPWRYVEDVRITYDSEQYRGWYSEPLKEGAEIDLWGVAHEPGSSSSMHMTYMRHPLSGIEEIEQIQKYPFPDYAGGDASHQKAQVDAYHARGLAAVGSMQCTVWESAWYLRSMEDLMVDMATGDPIAQYILDEVTDRAVLRAQSFANAGVDIVFLGDDIGMQHTAMMSLELYREWLKPRLRRVIQAVKAINPEILIFYHSCGFVTPFIDDLIEAGVEVLNPLQSECMDFAEIHGKYGGRISFHGAIGTQTVMPFGTPEEVRETVFRLLDEAGAHGGLFVAPTHLLEPEVPWENIEAYAQACRDYKR